jgi:hypothetical protein
MVFCEEMDLGCWLCDPPSQLISQFFELNVALGEVRNEHFRLGSNLHQLFREAGFSRPEIDSNFVLVLRGEEKRLLSMTFEEFAPEAVREQLVSQREADAIGAELRRVADDETTLLGFPLLVQVWARRE